MSGRLRLMAVAATIASGRFILLFCLISIVFFLMTGDISTTVHWLINALVLVASVAVMLGLLNSSYSLINDNLTSTPWSSSAISLSPLKRYIAILVSQTACKSIPFIAHSFLCCQAVFGPPYSSAKLVRIKSLALFQLFTGSYQLSTRALSFNANNHVLII
jgi:hypothetical protein